jgi:quercetin dioxygenase-like cupin family protein
MQITRIASAPRYTAPEHFDMACLRLQGREATSTEAMWVGMSHLLPGGHTSLKGSPQEKIDVVLEGQVTIRTETEEATLDPLDSVVIARGEARALENRTNRPATILLLMEGT